MPFLRLSTKFREVNLEQGDKKERIIDNIFKTSASHPCLLQHYSQ
jgi:hypothetical protein